MSRDYAVTQTSLVIRKWDAGQTAWTLGRAGDARAAADLRAGRDVQVRPEMFGHYGVEPYETWRQGNVNAITGAGWTALLGGVAGTTIGTKFGAANGRIGVGTSATAVTWGQTFLSGDTGSASTTSYYQLVSTAPVIAAATGPATLTFTAVFGTAVANFAWTEFGTDNAPVSGVYLNGLAGGYILFNRGVPAGGMGTKPSGQTWTATEVIQFGYPSADAAVNAVGP